MKRLLTLILSLFLIICLAGNTFATDDGAVLTIGATDAAHVVDNADLLTDSEEAELTRLAEEISQRQHCDVVILTENSLGGKTAEAYADDYFDYNGYGYGPDHSGILLLLSPENRDFAISTRGDAIQAFTDNGCEYLWSKCKSSLSADDYISGFRSYLRTADTMLSAYNGTLSDTELKAFQDDFNAFIGNGAKVEREKPSMVKSIVIALIVGFLLAFIPTSGLRSQLKSVRMKYNAASYRRPDSMHLNMNRDVYLYTNTTSRVIETQQRSGGSGGGSTTHVSSSGATHGGISGKY